MPLRAKDLKEHTKLSLTKCFSSYILVMFVPYLVNFQTEIELSNSEEISLSLSDVIVIQATPAFKEFTLKIHEFLR